MVDLQFVYKNSPGRSVLDFFFQIMRSFALIECWNEYAKVIPRSKVKIGHMDVKKPLSQQPMPINSSSTDCEPLHCKMMAFVWKIC